MSAQQEPTVESVTLRQHSELFYWWPIWVLSFAIAGLSYLSGPRLVYLPSGSEVQPLADGKLEIVPARDRESQPRLVTAAQRGLNIVFLTVLVTLIFLTGVQLSKVGEMILIGGMGLLYAGFLLMVMYFPEVFEGYLESTRDLPVYLSAGAYLFLGCVFAPLWFFLSFIVPHDQLIFTRTQLIVRRGFGEIVQPYTPGSIRVSVSSGDMKDWILGMGSGSVQVTLTGAEPRTFEFRGVLFVQFKLREVQRLLEPSA